MHSSAPGSVKIMSAQEGMACLVVPDQLFKQVE